MSTPLHRNSSLADIRAYQTQRVAEALVEFRNEHGREMSPHEKHYFDQGLELGMNIFADQTQAMAADLKAATQPEPLGFDLRRAQTESTRFMSRLKRAPHRKAVTS